MATELDPSCEQITSPVRSILIRIDGSATAADRARLTERALEAGFDGVEVSVDTSAFEAAAGVEPHSNQRHTTTSTHAAETETAIDTATKTDSVIATAACLRSCDVDDAVEEVKELLGLAAGIGATCLNLTIPPLRTEPGESGFNSYEEAMRLVLRLVRGVRFDAEAAGVALALEAGVCGGMATPMELRDIIDTASSWSIGACVDLGRTIAPCDAGKISAVAMESITTLRRRIHTVRIPATDSFDRKDASDPNRSAIAGNHSRNIERIAGALDSIMYRNLVVITGAGPQAGGQRPTDLCATSGDTRSLRSLYESIRPIAKART